MSIRPPAASRHTHTHTFASPPTHTCHGQRTGKRAAFVVGARGPRVHEGRLPQASVRADISPPPFCACCCKKTHSALAQTAHIDRITCLSPPLHTIRTHARTCSTHGPPPPPTLTCSLSPSAQWRCRHVCSSARCKTKAAIQFKTAAPPFLSPAFSCFLCLNVCSLFSRCAPGVALMERRAHARTRFDMMSLLFVPPKNKHTPSKRQN